MDDLNNIADTSHFDSSADTSEASNIKVIGVGGGGTNAADYLYKQGIQRVTFLACNTDGHSLRGLQIPDKILLGPTTTKGLGAGDDAAVGRQAGEESADDIRAMLNDDTRMVFVTAGMGGGTGTGAAPVIAQIAKDAGLLTVGIVTIPLFFEGTKKIVKALEGAEEMRKHVDTLLIINNERLNEIYPDLNMINAMKKADDTLANATRSIANMIHTRGYINADFRDVHTTLKDSKTAVISTGTGEGEHRVTKAIEDALNSPLLRNSDISTSKRLLFYLYLNPNAKNVVTMQEMDEITQFSANLSPNIGIKWGACFDESLGEEVKITILASGFDIDNKSGSVIDFSRKVEDPVASPSGAAAEPGEPVDMEEAAAVGQQITEGAINRTIEQAYGKGKLKDHNQEMARAKYVVLAPAQFDNDDAISAFERIPAYNRTNKQKEDIRSYGMEKPQAATAGTAASAPPSAAAPAQKPADPSAPKIVF